MQLYNTTTTVTLVSLVVVFSSCFGSKVSAFVTVPLFLPTAVATAVSSKAAVVTMEEGLMETLVTTANSYAAANGLQVQKGQEYQCAPISLLPNAYPRTQFEAAQQLAPKFNALVDAVSQDASFLQHTLEGVVERDEYTKKLLTLYNDLYVSTTSDKGKFAKTADRLGILRSDYMLHSDDDTTNYTLKQVELNTIAASFAGLAVQVAGLHKLITERYRHELKNWLDANQQRVMGDTKDGSTTTTRGVETNPALDGLARAMSIAHVHYQTRFTLTIKQKLVILFVVQGGETNTVDQRMLEFQLWQQHQLPVVRMSLADVHTQLQLHDETGALYSNEYEVSLVYFRAGYAPTDYPDGLDGIEWQARDVLEQSRATKCPNLGYHLAGTKKVQQELARPGTLERFVSNSSVLAQIKQAFAGLYSLGEDVDASDICAVKDAISGQKDNYVLKPQREGGGYNYYGTDLVSKLQQHIISSEFLCIICL